MDIVKVAIDSGGQPSAFSFGNTLSLKVYWFCTDLAEVQVKRLFVYLFISDASKTNKHPYIYIYYMEYYNTGFELDFFPLFSFFFFFFF